MVNQINANCRDKLGEYCHRGATTQDITDTATVLQIREGLALVESDLAELSAAIAVLVRKYRDAHHRPPNLQQATPITFGYKMASILAGIERHGRAPGAAEGARADWEFGGAPAPLLAGAGRWKPRPG